MSEPSNTHMHATGGPNVHHMPVAGRLALSVAVFIGLQGVAAIYGIEKPLGPALAFAGWVLFEMAMWALRRARQRRLHRKVQILQRQVHDLELEDIRLRAAEARERGDFDRFGG